MDDDETNNVFRFGSVNGGKGGSDAESSIPINDYVLTDVDNQELYATGFLVFTSQHVAVMRDYGKGAIPVLVVPLDRTKYAELVEDDEVT